MDPVTSSTTSDRRSDRATWTHYELGVAAQKLYDFIWDTYCDWYIELTKSRLSGEDQAAKEQAQQVLVLRPDRHPQAAAPLHALYHRGDLAGAAS